MQQIVQLYNELITAWNQQNAEAMARLFAKQGEMIGYDGSDAVGQEEITEDSEKALAFRHGDETFFFE